ncbi:jg14288 [Pararge aegeria aegeria]|uniref:Jg14288 protein n=1 Tax=Pararge aegeria aegeria TaxID=348720 RepID=A0A8S4RT58_9NEOP|nr:jg14288 [Pararge aegeria aegeria]
MNRLLLLLLLVAASAADEASDPQGLQESTPGMYQIFIQLHHVNVPLRHILLRITRLLDTEFVVGVQRERQAELTKFLDRKT